MRTLPGYMESELKKLSSKLNSSTSPHDISESEIKRFVKLRQYKYSKDLRAKVDLLDEIFTKYIIYHSGPTECYIIYPDELRKLKKEIADILR